ncbi:hypothetical protein EIP86_008283 [Pleurotus ostreatoroseus]|nr:hypothetical protein EIP86_008283 [Pleurotus ostreatoroseus]
MEMEETLEKADRPEEQSQCTVCKIICSCTTKVVCIDHVDKLCKCPPTKRVLRKRFDDTGLLDTHMKVTERANVPFSWRGKLDRLLSETARPPLKSLRNLLLEGDRISFPLRELHALRKCVVDQTATFLVRKTPRKWPPRRVRGRVVGADGAGVEDVEKPDHSMRELYALVREAKASALLQAASSLKSQDRDAYIQECQRLIVHGTTFNVQVVEPTEAEKIVMQEQLLKELDEETKYEQLTLEDVRQLFLSAHMCGLSLKSNHMKLLEMRLKVGEVWEGRRMLEELEEAAVVPHGVPIDPQVLQTLRRSRNSLLSGCIPTPPSDVMKLVQRGDEEYSLQAVKEMRWTADFAVDLENRCDSVLKNWYQHNGDSDIFLAMRQWRTYAKEHLTMFTLPNFDRLQKQLTLHFCWLEGLPWYCRSHHAAHGKPLLDDVVAATRPEDDLPPTDEYFTCICTNPVRPPAPGNISDAVQCDHCFARFHGLRVFEVRYHSQALTTRYPLR